MSKLDLAQVGFFYPILQDLNKKGCNTNGILKDSDLHLFSLDDPLGYVPIKCVYKLYDGIRKKLGVDDFINEFSDYYQLISIMQHGELMAYAPDVLTAIQIAIKYDQAVFTNERLFLRINGQRSILGSQFIDPPERGRDYVIYSNIALILNTFRLKFGQKWQPYDLYIQSPTVPDLENLIVDNSSLRIYVNQDFSGLSFDTSLLHYPMLDPVNSENSDSNIKCLDTLSSKIEQLLESNTHAYLPSGQKLSEYSNVSLRTLQRDLLNEGITITEIVDKWRFKKALKLLGNPSLTIKDISRRLSYSNVSNFNHAFRRWTNTNPSDYRSEV